MGAYGGLWGPMGADGNSLASRGTFGDLWAPLGANGGLWAPMGTYGHLRGPMGAYGGLWGPMGAYGHLFFVATFPAHTFSPFSHFGVQSLFYFCIAMCLIVQGASPMIFQLRPPFLFFSFWGSSFRFRHGFSQFPLGIRPLDTPPIDKNIRHLLG